MSVNVQPLPTSYRSIPARLRPMHPPLSEGAPLTLEDARLAIALIEALDAESREWYSSSLARLRAFVAGA